MSTTCDNRYYCEHDDHGSCTCSWYVCCLYQIHHDAQSIKSSSTNATQTTSETIQYSMIWTTFSSFDIIDTFFFIHISNFLLYRGS